MKRIKLYFFVLFVLLSLPFFLLVIKTRRDFQRDLFLGLRTTAEGIAADARIRMIEVFRRESNRPFTEYRYAQMGSQPLSPLSEFPVRSEVPGILGYFQIDPDRTFHTPVLPERSETKVLDAKPREELRSQLFQIVSSALLSPSDEAAASDAHRALLQQRADTQLLERVFSSQSPLSSEDVELVLQESDVTRPKLQSNTMEQLRAFDARSRKGTEGHYVRFSYGRSPDAIVSESQNTNPKSDRPLIVRGESAVTEIDPFQVSVSDSRWLVFYRSVWWEERRYVQGFVASQKDFLDATIVRAASSRARFADWHTFVLHGSDIIMEASLSRNPTNKPHLVYWSAAPHPLSAFSVALSVDRLPHSKGANLITLFSVVFGFLLCGSVYATYRMAAAQMELSAKKSDFVSAVSHELRTPLTSIRMYGDLLTQGWADAEKRGSYLKFIRDESERLSRLIENVLQIARLERGQWELSLSRQSLIPLVENCVEKMRDSAGRVGLEISLTVESKIRDAILDSDAFTQIVLNILENGVKYSTGTATPKVVLRLVQAGDESLVRVRDFGPGIPPASRSKIFERFYRAEGELTRKTQGAGLGLAIAKMLADRMHMKIDVINHQDGTEFCLIVPSAS